MTCQRCRRLREYQTIQRMEEEINPSSTGNNNQQEDYIYISGIRESNVKYFNPYDQCFCRDQSLLQQERLRTGIEIPGKCHPVDMCTNCDINYSGLCPQQNKYDSGILVDSIPVYPTISPYVRPIYYPHSPYYPWYPYSPYRPRWHPNGYRPRPRPRSDKWRDGGSGTPSPIRGVFRSRTGGRSR